VCLSGQRLIGGSVAAMNNLVLGIVIPGLVFVLSFVLTDKLYRHFSKK
jgi:hypothetical protein